MASLKRIVPCLWFDSQAEEAAKFYTSVFQNSRIRHVSHYGEAGQEVHGRKPGTVMVVDFELDGNPFTALNGGPHFRFNEAISLQVMCETQKEVDHFWERLSAGGPPEAQQCGWLKDRYGLSWQIVPAAMSEWSSDRDRQKADRVMSAMLRMKKLDIATLKRAYDGQDA